MSKIRVDSILVKNYRSFGATQSFTFPSEDYKKPIAITGYNNSGKTNLMNAILYGIGFNYISKDTFHLNDFHNRKILNLPEIELRATTSVEMKYDGKSADLTGIHKLKIQTDDTEIEGAKIESFKVDDSLNWQAFGASKYYNIFFINFHKIKDEISTQKTSWGNLKSFLAKHIKQIVDSDETMKAKKGTFESETKSATENILKDSNLSKFILDIKKNYSLNLRDNNCEVAFGLPEYEDIFLQMLFKIGLNGDATNLIPIDHFGDGYISMFVMAVIQAIAESKTTDKCLFLFEEPESFLHENHQEYFYKMVLCNLAERGHQVIYTTHSDKMVDIFDTKGIIRIEYDEREKQTVKKYNNTGIFSPNLIDSNIDGEVITLENYNSFIKSIEPSLNKILFSRKVVLVEGPNDIMAYKFAIEKKIEDFGKDKKYAETYLNFLNISIIAHFGKATAILLIDLCKHLGLDYFAINDWDFDEDFIQEVADIATEEDLKASNIYLKTNGTANSSIQKGMITTNWKLIKRSGPSKIHFNRPKLERVLGYDSTDKNSVKIWAKLNSITSFSPEFFPKALEDFLEFSQLTNADVVEDRSDVVDDLPF